MGIKIMNNGELKIENREYPLLCAPYHKNAPKSLTLFGVLYFCFSPI